MDGEKDFFKKTKPENQEKEFETPGLLDKLRHQYEAADLLFAEYGRLVDGAEKTAEEISQIYNEIFFEKQVDKKQVADAILSRSAKLLADAEERLKDAPEEEKEVLAKDLIEGLVKERMARQRMLEDLKKMALELNKRYADIYKQYDDIQHESFKSDAMAKEFSKGGSKEEMEDYEDYLDIMKDMEYHPATAWSVNEAHDLAEEKKRVYKKFDSQRIEKLLLEMNDLAKKLDQEIGKDSPVYYGYSADEVYDFIDKLKASAALQEALENKMDELIYGEKNTGENKERSLPEAILDKYNELIELAAKNKNELLGIFKTKVDITEEDLNNIMERVLVKARECLDNFKELIDKGDRADEAEILKKLGKYQADIVLFVETFKTLNREGKALELADFKNINISRRSGQEIPDEEKQEFEKIAEENWSKYFFKDEVIKEFKKSLKNTDNRFYTVKYGDKTIAFIRFDPQDNCELYAGSLNVRPDLRGSTIGEAVLKTILKEEAHDNTINAKVYSRLPILKRYIGEFGFVATDMIDNYHGRAGEYGFKMLLAEEENQGYKLFNRPLKEIKAEHHDNTYALNQPEIVLKFNSSAEREVMMGQCQKLLDYGYVLTAYRPEKEKAGSSETESVYLAFEKRARQLEQAA